MVPEPVPFACMLTGDRYPQIYVERLHSMISRFYRRPFTLTVFTDRPRRFKAPVKQVSTKEWTDMLRPGMRPTTQKIRLLQQGVLPEPEFLYMDVTLVIQKDLEPLLEFAFGSPADLVILQDWNYDCYNSCIMRIRQGPELEKVYLDFMAGSEYPRRNKGDQDFIHASIRAHGLQDRVAIFPKEMIVMYHNARRIHRTDPKAAYELLESGIIVKFFGWAKMHELLNPIYRLRKIRWKKDRGPADAKFWVKELKERWR
jgi:hypothetical protein